MQRLKEEVPFLGLLILIPIVLALLPPFAISKMPDRWWVDIHLNLVTSGFKDDHTLYFSRSVPKTVVGYWHGEIDPPGCEFSGGPTIYGANENEHKKFSIKKLAPECEIAPGKHTFSICRKFPVFLLWYKEICTETEFYSYEKRTK